jgi:hypothetical protein
VVRGGEGEVSRRRDAMTAGEGVREDLSLEGLMECPRVSMILIVC